MQKITLLNKKRDGIQKANQLRLHEEFVRLKFDKKLSVFLIVMEGNMVQERLPVFVWRQK